MTEDEKKKLEEQLDYLYNESKNESGELMNPEDLMATPSMFGVLPQDNEMDYKEEMQTSFNESKEIIENMASMYLDEKEEIINNKYIKNKILNDAQNLSDMNFLQKVAKRVLVKQMTQIEMGEATPRHYEVISIMMKEIRENIKQSTVTVSTMEGFYQKIRTDMGMGEKIENNIEISENTNNISTVNNINDKLEEILKRRNSNKDDNK